MARNRSIVIYLKPGIEEDDQIYDVWVALKDRGRPQDVFRRMLREGLKAMVESGELPRVALAKVDTSLLGPVPMAHATLLAAAPTKPKAPRPVVPKPFQTPRRPVAAAQQAPTPDDDDQREGGEEEGGAQALQPAHEAVPPAAEAPPAPPPQPTPARATPAQPPRPAPEARPSAPSATSAPSAGNRPALGRLM